jgi:PIN domain nuclease of toxin-antitoxin system
VYLLDTHALVWGISVPEQLPPRVREILAVGEVKASVVSYWELMLKKGRPNALVVHPVDWWERYVTRTSVEELPIRVSNVDRLDGLGEIHRLDSDADLTPGIRALDSKRNFRVRVPVFDTVLLRGAASRTNGCGAGFF